uniref:Uncharacterized protein n=1 Tax=Setaria viridis TaxID=4556 RepID=A0A4U6T9L4_SETVI|nr:hypothetical protein SEVIR_9G477100v2 [Setaria viridis]
MSSMAIPPIVSTCFVCVCVCVSPALWWGAFLALEVGIPAMAKIGGASIRAGISLWTDLICQSAMSCDELTAAPIRCRVVSDRLQGCPRLARHLPLRGPRAKINFPSPADAAPVLDLVAGEEDDDHRYTASVGNHEAELSESSDSGALPDFSWQGVSCGRDGCEDEDEDESVK